MFREEEREQISRNSKEIVEKLKYIDIKVVLAFIFLSGSIIVLIFSTGRFNLFFNVMMYLLSILSLLTVFLALMSTKNLEQDMTTSDKFHLKEILLGIRRIYYASGIIIVATFFILISFTAIFTSILIISPSIFFLFVIRNPEENKKWFKFLSKSPMIPLFIFVIIIGIMVGLRQPFTLYFPLLIELALTFIFLVFLSVTIPKEKFFEENIVDEKSILQDKIAEVFKEKKCYFHQSKYSDKFCPNCQREVCSVCLLDFNNQCIFCFSNDLENKALLFDSVIYLGLLLFTIYLISFIWGMYAPLPMISVFIEWLGLHYTRFIILFYYSIANFIFLTVLSGGGYLASKQLKIKLKSLNREFSFKGS